jgi:hypothetical protein
MASKVRPENQGEGNRDAARRYNDRAQEHARSGRSDQAAEEARREVDGAEALRDAEREGKKHIAEEDPEVEAVLDDDDRNAGRD